MKIDVEGYEFPVLRGLQGYFENITQKPPIICEITPEAYSLLGARIEELVEYMGQYGYEPYNIYNLGRKIDITKFKKTVYVVWRAKPR